MTVLVQVRVIKPLSMFAKLWQKAQTRALEARASGLGGGLVGTMIGALVTILIFAVLAPVVAQQVGTANTSYFGTGAAALFGLTTLFFVILGIVGIIKLVR